jgi:phosphotransferase system IIB component
MSRYSHLPSTTRNNQHRERNYVLRGKPSRGRVNGMAWLCTLTLCMKRCKVLTKHQNIIRPSHKIKICLNAKLIARSGKKISLVVNPTQIYSHKHESLLEHRAQVTKPLGFGLLIQGLLLCRAVTSSTKCRPVVRADSV